MRKNLLHVEVVRALRTMVRHTEISSGGMRLKLSSLLRWVKVLALNLSIPLLNVIASTATPACGCLSLIALLADAVRVGTRLASRLTVTSHRTRAMTSLDKPSRAYRQVLTMQVWLAVHGLVIINDLVVRVNLRSILLPRPNPIIRML